MQTPSAPFHGRGLRLFHAAALAAIFAAAAGMGRRAAAALVDETALRLPIRQTQSYRFVAADLNGDGHPDLLQIGVGGGRLLLNDGSGVFADAPTQPPEIAGATAMDAAPVDVDGDGDTDIILLVFRGRSRLLLNDGFGAFAEAASSASPSAVQIGRAHV